jgi:hypothetical protein
MRPAAVLLLVALAGAAGAAAAAAITVQQDHRIDTLAAERLRLDERFLLDDITLAQAVVSLPAVGTSDQPAPMTPAYTPAGTAVQGGDWTYTATVRERSNGSVPKGEYDVELFQDGRLVGDAYLAQNVSNPMLTEGARVTFDLGSNQAPDAPLFLLRIMPTIPGQAPIRLTSALDGSLDYVWQADDGADNPTLSDRAGEQIVLRAVNGDGTATHALGITDANGNLVAGWTPDLTNRGDTQDLPWTPGAAGTYHYQCRYHPTMKGDIQVSP